MGRIKSFVRIRNSKEFDTVYRRADKTWHTPWFVLFYKRSSESRVGFVASRKLGNAVHRNRAKRLLRAHFITHSDDIATGHFVLVAKPAILDTDFAKVSKAFRDTLRKCNALADCN